MLLAMGVVRRSRMPVTTLAWARYALPRCVAGLGAFALGLAPMSLLNHVRFGTYNPLSYGPCNWQFCGYLLGEGSLTAQSLASFAAPVTLFGAVVVGALALVRRSRAAIGAVLALSLLVLALLPSLRGTSLAMLRVVFGFFVDLTRMDLTPFERPGDGLGWLRGSRLVKALLQSSPFLVAALVVKPSLRGGGARVLLPWAPALAHASELALLARYPGASAFGWPYLFCRYGIYGVPFLAVLAATGVRRVRLEPAHVAAVVALALLGFAALVTIDRDFDLQVRAGLLYGPLALAGLLLAALLLSRRAPLARRASPMLLALTVACSLAVTLGIDTARTVTDALANDQRLDRFAALVPQRFALAGWGPDSDPLLALRAERDVHYVDLVETSNWDGFRQIIDKWTDDGRPIYGAFPRGGTPKFVWPYADWDVPAELLDEKEGIWRIGPPRRRVPPPKGVVAPPAPLE
jgi:hypothetical protein